MVSLPDLFVEENNVVVSHSSDTPAVRRNNSSLAEAETCDGDSDGQRGFSAATKRRARVMKALHDLHRLAWARRQPDCTKLLEASPELAAADLTSRTDAVTVHYSRSRWEHVASAVPPLSYNVRTTTAFLHRLVAKFAVELFLIIASQTFVLVVNRN